MLDGRADTCWRMAGDGTGVELTFQLAGPTTMTRVGLINGYAKNAVVGGRNLNWYVGNRRVLSAQWVFDDGTHGRPAAGGDQEDADDRPGRPGHTSVGPTAPGRGQQSGDRPQRPRLHGRQRGHARRDPSA
jgi:hypothetical protein